MNWRNSKLFVYGWLPVRLVASAVAHVAMMVVCVAIFAMWLNPHDAIDVWQHRP